MSDSFQNIFPNNSKTLAYYDPLSQIINLCSIDTKDFLNINNEKDIEKRINLSSLFFHEFTHWLDHISTLWGHNKITSLYNSLNAKATNCINDFWRIKEYCDSCKTDRFYDYYTVKHNDLNGSVENRWQYNYSVGLRFQSNGYPDPTKPILFTNFKTHNDIEIARIPISIASLLETNAVYQENYFKFNLLPLEVDKFKQVILKNQYTDDLSNLIYNSNLILYNVISHLTANTLGLTDIIQTLDIASSISTIVLNLPSSENVKLNSYTDLPDDLVARISSFEKLKDKGFIYYSLVHNLKENYNINNYSNELLLKSSNLSAENEIENQVLKCMEKNIENLIQGPFYNKARNILNFGIKLFKQRGIDGRKEGFTINPTNFDIRPTILCGDLLLEETKFNLSKTMSKLIKNEKLNLDEEYFIYEKYKKEIYDFSSICGI